MWGMDGGAASMGGGMNPMMAMMMGMMESMNGGGGGKGGGNRSSPYGGGSSSSWDDSSWKKKEKTYSADGSTKTNDLPTIVGISVSPSSSLVVNGYPAETCALEYRKDQNIFSDAGYILQSFFGDGADLKEVCQLEHDPEATSYPEVYQAWKAAGQEDNCMTVATCPSMGQWAVGLGGKKNAERAAKLSLALSLAAVAEPIRVKTVARHFPLFAKLCNTAGIDVPQGEVPPASGTMPGATGAPARQIIDPSGTFPPLLGLKVAPTSAMVLKGFPADIMAIEFSKENAPIFSESHHILQCFFDEMVGGVVQLTHDPDASIYPEIFEAWKNAGQLDNLPTVAVCPSMGQWAVGFGGKKNAERAAKLAMALTLATVVDPMKLYVVQQHYPQFAKMCKIAGIGAQ